MTLATFHELPQSSAAWDKFHFNHFLDHKIILGVVAQKVGTVGATFIGTGSGTNLTVTSVTGTIVFNGTASLRGNGVPTNTAILSQSSGTPGGAGVYVTSHATTSSGATLESINGPAVLFMPPIYPVPGNIYTAKIAQWHQILHQQMNTISGSPSSDMLQVDLSTPENALSFLEPNYRDHLIFHQFVGIRV